MRIRWKNGRKAGWILYENEEDLGFVESEMFLAKVDGLKEKLTIEKKVSLSNAIQKAHKQKADGIVKLRFFTSKVTTRTNMNLGNLLCDGMTVKLGEYE